MKLSEAIRILENAGVENARYDARTIFETVGKIPKSTLLLLDCECSSPELIFAVERRAEREPLQYILGEVSFYRETYKVNKNCLIPRQDTEILVDYAVKNIPSGRRFLDVCTGSGCVAVSVLKNTKDTKAVALDISADAIELAEENAKANSVSDRLDFVCLDALNESVDENFFAILSNPPYVTKSAYENLAAEIYFEPKIAFVGGESGLVFYEKILESYIDKLDPSGFFAFEIGFDQADALRALASAYKLNCEIIKDLSGNDRVAVLRKS